MIFKEVELTDGVLEELIFLSQMWENENSCYGYIANDKSDIEGNQIYVAEDNGNIVAYLFGNKKRAENMQSIIPNGTDYFEIEELYVIPELRSKGIGKDLFNFVESTIKNEQIEYIMLNTATKNHKAVLHFYIDIVGMDIWSSRLFKRI
jgi:ribosomal protein S18 acetylase RimI-like enzyme